MGNAINQFIKSNPYTTHLSNPAESSLFVSLGGQHWLVLRQLVLISHLNSFVKCASLGTVYCGLVSSQCFVMLCFLVLCCVCCPAPTPIVCCIV